jgi:hypothetical protein
MELVEFLIFCVSGIAMLIGIGCAIAVVIDDYRQMK